MSRKKHRKRRKKTCFCYSSELGSRSTCNTIIALSFLFILIVVITLAALAIYIGMEIILDGSLRVTYGDYYTTELYNRTSQLFLSKAHTYKIMIEKVFAKSILGPSLKQCIIMGFKNGSLIIFYRLILDRRKIASRTYVNIEETAKKILYDEITALKPAVFSNIRLDPKQIILRKHSANADSREAAPEEVESSTEDATISNVHPGVLKRFGHTTPSIVRRRISTPATTPLFVSTMSPTRAKVTKKPRTPVVEKTTKAKQHEAVRRLLSSPAPSAVTTAPKKQSNFDINGSANRYSFVSDDSQPASLSAASKNTTHQGFGEAEVIIIPATVDGDHGQLARNNAPVSSGVSERVEGARIPILDKHVDEKEANFPTSLPTRSNVALNRPLRPKPTMSPQPSPSTSTLTSSSSSSSTSTSVTEDPAIVLNTEVVTSKSMQMSYGQSTELSKGGGQPVSVLPSQPPKFKNIIPRSIRDVENQSVAERNSSLSSMVDQHRKHPSNESLFYILEHLALVHTKSTLKTLYTSKGYDGLLLTRPMHKISTSATPTTFVDRITTGNSLCQGNATKQCSNGQCISEHLWCNQFADCNDASDERNCTCADYLRTQFALEKICDGIVDCWDFSDENLCEWCSPEMYVCSNAKLCIPQGQVCDGVHNCPLGDDEKNCITISQFQQSNKSDVVYRSTGVITVKRAGIWGKLCFTMGKNFSSDENMRKLSELGKAVCKTMTFRNFTNLTIIGSANDEPTSVYYKLNNVVRNDTDFIRRKNFKFAKTVCQNKQVVQITCENLECGIQTQIGRGRARGRYRGERRSRIVGGGSATLGAWPWQAALYKEGEFQCGATLISNKWLLSAGHCFYNAQRDYWVARLGILRRGSTLPSPHEQIRSIQRILVHPNYAEADFMNDIALLEMSTEVYITNFVRPICLPDVNSTLPDGTLCTVIGWGQTKENGSNYPDTLQEVQLPVLSPAECRKRTVFLPLYKITDSMLCAGFERGGRDACLGDSGGPLMCRVSNNTNNESWHLYGVTSNGNGCARAHRPGVYTKVTNYLSWIDYHVKNTLHGQKIGAPACNGFRCPLGECLPKARICNGYMECSDGSDEHAC